MVIREKPVTIVDFEAHIARSTVDDPVVEFIAGEIVEVPSNPYASKIGYNLGSEVRMFVKVHRLGHVTGENGGYQVMGERYAPDVAFITYQRQPELAQEGYNPLPPDLAIEVEFPVSIASERRLRFKLVNYLAAGTTVWVAYPETLEIEIYVPGEPVRILGIDDTLDGGKVLPGFSLPVREIFAN